MRNINTKPVRLFPEDEDFLRDIARERRDKKIDRIEQTPARILKAYVNATKQDIKLRKWITEAPFR
jgi:hypothetical protein